MYYNLWTLPDKKSRWFEDFEKLVEAAKPLSADGYDCYYSVCPRKNIPDDNWERGDKDTVALLPCVWCEIDILNSKHHKEKDLPPNGKAAQWILDGFATPSRVVFSGGGFHCYWDFDEHFIIENETDLLKAKGIVHGFQLAIKERARKKGWKVDSTHDLARVLRVIGTKNWKDKENPKDVILAQDNKVTYKISDFEQYLTKSKGNTKRGNVTFKSGAAKNVIDLCAFIRHCVDDAATLPEPDWFAMVANLALCSDGIEAIHEASRPYDGYTYEETQAKILRAMSEAKPHTCEYIMQELGFLGCADCPYNDVSAPVALADKVGYIAEKRVNDAIENNEIEGKKIIEDLALVKMTAPDRYLEKKAELKGKINLNDLERGVNTVIKQKEAKARKALVSADAVPLDDVFSGFPLSGLSLPRSWRFDDNGIYELKRDAATGEDVAGKCVCPVPVGITKRIRNLDDYGERLELSFFRDAAWHSIKADRATVFTRQGVVQLGNHGLPVSSESASLLIRYLEDFERSNMTTIPVVRAMSRLGWVDSQTFAPYAVGDVDLDLEDAPMAGGFHAVGDLECWKDAVAFLYDNDITRFYMGASFAAPLLQILGQRVMVVHLWGKTTGGKSGTLHGALSVWGQPDDIKGTFNATTVGFEKIASLYCDLPLGIDEKQIVKGKDGIIERLIYMLSMGKGRIRGSKTGGLQGVNRWRTIALTNGESPIVESSSGGGVATRVIELYWPMLPQDPFPALYDSTREHYGVAGMRYVSELIKCGRIEIRALYDDIRVALRDDTKIGSHVDLVACVSVADMLSRKWLWGIDDATARSEALGMASGIMHELSRSIDSDDGERAWQLIEEWVASNPDRFNGALNPQWGYYDSNAEELLYVYPQYLDALLTDHSFSPRRIYRDLGDAKHIITYMEGDKIRYKSRQSKDGRTVRMMALLMPKERESWN